MSEARPADFPACRAKRASQGLRAKYRGTREAGLVNVGGSPALSLPRKGALKRYRCVSIISTAEHKTRPGRLGSHSTEVRG